MIANDSSKVFFGMYGSGIEQERGTLYGIALPIEREAGASYSSGWRDSGLKIETAFRRVSSKAREEDRVNKSRVTLAVARGGVKVPLYVATSKAHTGAREYGTRGMTAAIRAMKCREDMTQLSNCSSSTGDQNVAYVCVGNLQSTSAPGEMKVEHFEVDGRDYTARYNEKAMSVEFVKEIGKWLKDNNGKAMVMACLPPNTESMEEVKRVIREEELGGQRLPGIRERSRAYFNALPAPARAAHVDYGAFLESQENLFSKETFRLQVLLGSRGYDCQRNGLMDSSTKASLLDFQERKCQSVSGVLDGPTRSALQWSSTVCLGDSGPEVRKIQKLLGLPVDGRFGESTRSSLLKFQERHNIVSDGTAASLTREMLARHPPYTCKSVSLENAVIIRDKTVTFGFECEFRLGDRAKRNVVSVSGARATPRLPYLEAQVDVEESSGNYEVRSVVYKTPRVILNKMVDIKQKLGKDEMRGFHLHMRLSDAFLEADKKEKVCGWLGRLSDAILCWRLENRKHKWALGQWSQTRPSMQWLLDARSDDNIRGTLRMFRIGGKLDIELRGLMNSTKTMERVLSKLLWRFTNSKTMAGAFPWQSKSMDVSAQEKLVEFFERYLPRVQCKRGTRPLDAEERGMLNWLQKCGTADERLNPALGGSTVHGRGNVPLWGFEHAPFFSDEVMCETSLYCIVFQEIFPRFVRL